MRTRTGTGVVIALFLAFSLLGTVGLVAQDNILPGAIGTQPDASALNCWKYAADGTTCIAGQYYRGDGTVWNTGVANWTAATPSAFGAWKIGTPGSPGVGGYSCNSTACHALDGSPVKNYGYPSHGDYVIGGHKNILRKITPGQPWSNLEGLPYSIGLESGLYLDGWSDSPYLWTSTSNGPNNYGTGCARCHTTGYRFDAHGPEPTQYDPTAKTFQSLQGKINLTPNAGGAGSTSSWFLTGIQCERCHNMEAQLPLSYDASRGGRASHKAPAGFNWGGNNPSGEIPNVKGWINDTTSGGPGFDFPRPVPRGGDLCLECHRTEASWTATTGNGEIHILPLPGFEGYQAPPDGLTGPQLVGQFTSKGSCSIATFIDYDACIQNGGTWPYKPSLSHGANGAQAFLNSPHARFVGTIDVANQASPDQSVKFDGSYNSHFTSYNTTFDIQHQSGHTTSGCTVCHDVHGTLIEPISKNNYTQPIRAGKQCTDCHTNHTKAMAHPTGAGTPFPTGQFGDSESCKICHMMGANANMTASYHFLRINADVNYTTFLTASQYYTYFGSGQVAPLQVYDSGETMADPASGFTVPYPAVGLDVDMACGQCHVGGNGSSNPYGIATYKPTSGTKPLPHGRAFLANAAAGMHNTAAAAPTFNVNLPGFGGPTSITISSPDKATIFYTIDGTQPKVVNNSSPDPTTTTQIYSTPISVTNTTTIYAVAAGPQSYGLTPSPVVGGTYGVQVAPTPVIAPTGAAINYPATLSVKLSDSVTAASICYTTDGSAPVAGTNCVANGTSITVNKSMVVKAMATVASYGNSSVASATFTVKPPTPSWSNVAPAKFPGTYVGAVTAALTDADANAQICYTTDGTTPTAASTCVASGAPITVSASATIKAIAVDGTAVSGMTSGTFVIK